MRKITLPSGKVAEINEFKGKHIREAQKIAGGDESKMMPAMLATCITIDGEPFLAEDFDELDGFDALHLMGEFNKPESKI